MTRHYFIKVERTATGGTVVTSSVTREGLGYNSFFKVIAQYKVRQTDKVSWLYKFGKGLTNQPYFG